MTFVRRLESLERQLAVPVTSGRGAWIAFWPLTTRTLTPFPAALAAARAACRQTPRDWSGDAGARQSFLRLVEAVERALRDFPEADAAMEAAFGAVDVTAEVRAAVDQMRQEEEERVSKLSPMPRPGECPGWDAFCELMGWTDDGSPKDEGPAEGSAYSPRPATPR
jgi:hypothetical protein